MATDEGGETRVGAIGVVHARALAAAPSATFAFARRTVCPAAYEAYGAGFLATESGRATCAGLFAVISVNVVLLAYVATAVFYGGEDEATDAQTKKDQ